MRYKVGDKVRIKTWEAMEREYGIKGGRSINCDQLFTRNMERCLKECSLDRILTINYVKNRFYTILETNRFHWSDDMIECLAEKEIIEPIFSRFEILDL